MPFKRGDHICAIYSSTEELTRQVARFLAQGLEHHERCWYVGHGNEMDSLRAALRESGIDVTAAMQRKALHLISGDGAYIVHGTFNPEVTMQIFNDAIEEAYTDGFTGFRAAAEMSWALKCAEGTHQVVVYEALLKSLFASCRAIGLCLYHRECMPLDVIDGALSTHPIVGAHGHYTENPFYEPSIPSAAGLDPANVLGKLRELDHLNGLPSERT